MNTEPPLERLLANRYQLKELVGKGYMGEIYRAKDIYGGATVAVKVLSRAHLNLKMVERFGRVAGISTMLGEKSNHIVIIKDYGLDEDGIPFYVMELLEGKSLKELMKLPLELPQSLNLIHQICLAMEIAHNGIIFEGEIIPVIHQDIKPSNIFIIKNQLVKVLDFGIAELLKGDYEQSHKFMAPQYCSPEQILGKKLDNRSDIYSLGVVMYEMVAKELPFFVENMSREAWEVAHQELPPKPLPAALNLPEELGVIIMKCLAKRPGDRIQGVGEILQVIKSLENPFNPQIQEPEAQNKIHEKIEQKPGAEKLFLPEENVSITLKFQEKEEVALPTLQPENRETIEELSLEEIYLQNAWPEDKPLQKIVFPCLTNRPEGMMVSIWAMLECEDIVKRMYNLRYSHFLFQSYPHPMVLWITLLYSHKHEPRWLPCYLDLKQNIGQEVVRTLAEVKTYHILLFALEEPQQCQHVMNVNIRQKQRHLLEKWANVSNNIIIKKYEAHISKQMLRESFEKTKQEIMQKLAQDLPLDS
ncbi:MAG: serine/threonine protein kinase [Gomphosphaeria aponina SAG 52.96 = DSM 107014]|uniref:Serine/threonine protein kinase n=1 Tax=Gomphosphaeria aponina SAG 52.96 = DSM 107014 TaxID=1521640 RepID=A0A941GQH2_9CHRO|nr:serine/threonine protein kinase [Gomphosphaeria aponina SAG 52.96 = DSM 107014]